MSNRLYVANLPVTTTDDTLRAAFSPHGTITHVFIATDRDTTLPKGYGFVTYDSAEAARASVAAMNGVQFEGSTLAVSAAREPEAVPVRTFVRPPQPGRGRPGGFSGRGGPGGPGGFPGGRPVGGAPGGQIRR